MVQVQPGGHLPLGVVMTRGGQLFDDSDLSYDTNAPAKIKAAGGRGRDGDIHRQDGGRHHYHQDVHVQAVELRVFDGRGGDAAARRRISWACR